MLFKLVFCAIFTGFVFLMVPKRSKNTCFSYQNGSTFPNISKSKNLNSEPKNIGF